MYYIYQIDDNHDEKLISCVDSEKEFITFIKKYIEPKFKITTVESLTNTDIETNKCFKYGHYLLINNRTITLVHKFKKSKKGYLYNYTSSGIEQLFLWKMLKYDEVDQKKISTESKITDTWINKILDCNEIYSKKDTEIVHSKIDTVLAKPLDQLDKSTK
jgi:hypothetical protein